MKLLYKPLKLGAFMLAEVVMGMALVTTMIVSLMAGLMFCQTLNRLSRDSIQATQILVSKTEAIRLVSWDDVLDMQTNSGPVQFIQSEGGVNYRGTVSVGPSEVSSSYSNDLRKVSVFLSWETGNVRRHRAFHTLVAKGGMWQYVN